MNFKILQIILLLIFTFCCASSKVQGQSVIGGEVSYHYLSPNTYEVILDVYADCNVPFLGSGIQVINWSDLSCGVSDSTITVNLESGYPKDVSPICASATNTCNGGTNLGRNHYRYSGTLSLPVSCNSVLVSFTYQDRQSAINTLNSPDTQAFYVEARFDATTSVANSAPEFVYKPLFFGCTNQRVDYSCKAVDPDGDSLAYSLVSCLKGHSLPVNYILPYTGSNPLSSSGPALFINNLTGAMELNSTMTIDAPICVLVQEYRNGTLVGSLTRDIQFRSSGCPNTLPTLSGINNGLGYQKTATVGTPLSFFVVGNDLGNFSAPINVTMLYDSSLLGSTFTIGPGPAFGLDAIRGNFGWTPMAGDEGINTFTVYVDDGNCPRLADQIRTYTINVQPAPPNLIITSPDTSICRGDSAMLSALGIGPPGPINYQWTPSTGLSNSAIPNPKASPFDTTTYTVTATYSDATVSTSQVRVNVLARPTASIVDSVNVLCHGASTGSITAAGSGGNPGYTYLWDAGASNQTTATAINLNANSYCVTVTDTSGCFDVICDTLTQPTSGLNANVTNIMTGNCTGGQATGVGVGGTGGYTYAWSDGQTTATAVGLQFANNPYTVIVTDSNGCTASNTFSIGSSTVISAPDIQAADTTVCTGDTIRFTTTTTGSIRYHWSGPSGFTSNLQSPSIFGASVIHQGTYFLETEDTLTGCFSVDTSLYIAVNRPPNPPFIVGGGIICDGATIHIEDLRGTANCALLWIGPVTSQTGVGLSVDVNPGDANYQSGIWTLEYTDTLTGCMATSNPVFVNIVPNPPQPSPVINGTVCQGGSVSLSVPSVLTATVNWYANPSRVGGAIYVGNNVVIPGITSDTTFYVEYQTPNCTSTLGFVNIVVSPNPGTPDISPNLIICEGADINLFTTSNADTFRWSHPNRVLPNQQNILISPSVLADSGLYTLSIVDANGCVSPDTFVYVSINSNPTAPLAETNAPICNGEDLELYHSGGCALNTWLAPNGSIISITSDTLRLLSTDVDYGGGNWRFICQDAGACSDTSNFVNVQINPSPPTVSPFGNGFVCIGDSVRLGVPLVSGASYDWYSNASLTIPTVPGTGPNIIVPNITTDSTFYVKLTIGNCSSVGQILVQVHPAAPQPDIPADFDICAGDTLFLTTPSNANSYQWTLPSGATINNRIVRIPNVTPLNNSGSYTLSIRHLNNCPVPDTTVVVTVNPIINPPSIFSDTICAGDTLFLTASLACDSIEWTSPSGISFIGGDTIFVLPGTPNYVNGGNWTASCLDTATGCQSLVTNHVVQIRPIPAKPIVDNNGLVCIGETVELSTPIILGASYNWYTEDSSLLIGPGPIRNVPNITSDTVFLLSITINGCSNSDTTQVRIHARPANPVLPDTIEVCELGTLQLSTTSIQPTYQWTGPNGFNSTQQNPLIFPAMPADSGYYFLVLRDGNTCPSEKDSVLVIINRLPVAPNIMAKSDSVCYGDSIFLVSDRNCGQLIWEGPSGIPFVAGDSIFIDSLNIDYQNGNWTVLCVDSLTGCQQQSNSLRITIKPVPAPPIFAPISPICVGDNVNLSMSLVAGASYQWLAFDSTRIGTFPNITIAGLENDTTFYGLIVLDGCESIDAIPVYVNPRPATPDVSVVDTLCASSFIQFNINPPNPAGTIYTITGPNGYSSNGTNTAPFVFPIDTNATGNYVIYATDINGCQSFDTTIFILVQPIPSIPSITGTGIVCRGDSIRLEAGACDSLVWSNLAFTTIISTVNNPNLVIGEGMPGYDTTNIWQVRCFDRATGCVSNFSNGFNVEIKERPVVNPSNSGAVCFNGSVTLSIIQQTIPSTYIWSTDSLLSDTVGTGTSVIIDSITTDSIFYLEVKNAYGCSTIGFTQVLVNPILARPDAEAIDSIICEGEDIYLSELNYTTGHQWTGPNGFVSNSQSPIITTATANQSGLYSVFVLDANGCASPVDSITIVVHTVPIAPIISGGNNICDGDSILLSANTFCDSTVWLSSLDTIIGSGNILGIGILDAGYANTTWTLFCYDTTSGCFDSSNVLSVNIIPSPPLPVINNNSNNSNFICGGDSGVLIASTVLGASSIWYSDSSLTNPIGTGDTLIINNITNDTIVYLQQAFNGCLSPRAVDTIFYAPAAAIPNIGANQLLCQGDSIYLTTTSLGTAYFWTDSSGFTSTQQNPIIANASPANTGTYYLFLTDNNGCVAPTVSMKVDANLPPPTPILFGNDTTCNLDTLIFGSNRPIDVRIEWVTPNNDTFATDSVVIITSDSIYYQFGQWTVIFTDTTTGCQITKDTIFRIETIPTADTIANSGPVCIGSSVVLSTSQIAGVTAYTWFRADTTIAGFGRSITVSNIVSDALFSLVVRTPLGCNYFIDSNLVLVYPPSTAPSIVVDTLHCVGDLVQFNTDSATAYTWTGPSGIFSYQQNPTIGPVTTADAGLYTLSIVDSNACNTPVASIFVGVSAPPNAPTANPPSLICQGDSLRLNSSAGTCDSAYWVGPGNRILAGANLIIPSDSSDYVAGNWQVFCVDQSSGCEVGSNIITVNIQTLARPSAISNGPVCIHDSVRLTANFVTGANYLWFSDSLRTDTIGFTRIISVDSISRDSIFYVIMIDSNGCVSPQAQTTVNVRLIAPAPTIGGDVSVCEGENIQLMAGQFSLFGYSWTGPNGYTSNQRNPIIPTANLSDAGTYSLSVLDLYGCNSADTSLQVLVDSLPAAPTIANFLYLCASDTLFLNSDSVTAHCDSVQWIGPNGINYPVVGRDVAIPPTDTNHIGGLWQIQCIDTSTGCFSTSNFSLVIIVPNPDTQATASNGPICIGGTVNLSTGALAASTNYTWYADASLTNIAGTGINPAIQNITSDTTFYLVITNAGACSSDPIPTPVLIYPPGNAPLVSADTQYCEGDSIFLTTTTIASSYQWTSNNGFVDTLQTALVTGSASILDSGLYTLSVVDSNGCTSRDTSFRITVNALPLSPSIVSNSPICFGEALQLSSSGQCGQSQWIGPLGNSVAALGTVAGGSNLWTIGTSTIIPLGDSSYGNANWYMICMDPATGCQAISNTITVSIDSVPSIDTILNTGSVCIGDSVDLSVIAQTSSGLPLITWYQDAALTQALGIGANISVPTTNGTTFFVEVRDSATGCTTVDSTTVSIYSVSPAPNMPANITLCEGDLLSLATSTLGNGYNWTGPNGFVDSVASPTPFITTNLDSGTYYLSVIDTNNCPSLTGAVDVIINIPPNAPVVMNSGPGCTGDSIVLMASTILGATYEWFKLPFGTSVGQGQNYTLSNISLADTGLYYVVVTLNACTAQSDSTMVTIYTNNTAIASVGLDQNLCGVDTTTISAALPPANITGLWTTSSGATIVNPNATTTFVANLAVGTNMFYWTLSNASCPSISTDTLIVVVAPPNVDTANAGVNQNLCGATSTNLSGNSPVLSNGTWTQSTAQTAAGVLINTSNNPLTNVTGLLPGNTYTFVWEFDNGVCGIHSTDTVDIIVAIAPTILAQAGGNILTCTQDTLSLSATNPTIGTGTWTTNSSAVIITPTQANTIVSNLQQDTTIFVWTLSNGTCLNYDSDSIFVILGGVSPVANADVFNVSPTSAILIDVLPNDVLTSNWDIYINTPMTNGQMLNLNTGEFELNLQGVTNNQSFIYELCNPACPANCDTALVLLNISSTIDCDIPNIFTPNEDGVNDLFEVPCLENGEVGKLLVFNRWGDLVYQSDNYQNQWNGTHQGKALPDGTYFYILRIGAAEPIQGSIELRR